MSSTRVGRLLLGPPAQWHENVGDPITNLGGAPVPQPRAALRHSVTLDTFAADGQSDTLATRLTRRRQLRAMLNNSALKLQGYLYIQYSDDPEQNGWYVPDQGTFTDGDGASGLATGWWKLESVVWMLAGHQRTNREARNVWMKDLRGGTFWRDTLKYILSTDFSALPALQLTALPNGANSAINTVTAQVVLGTALPTGRDGGTCQICAGLNDLATVSYERAESALNSSDVIVYDRRGNLGPLYRQTVLADNPVSYWRLNESSGTLAADQLGANPGTYTGGVTLSQAGALSGSGDTDTAISLDGATGYMRATPAAFMGAAAWTAEVWMKPTSFPAGNHALISTRNGVNGSGAMLYISGANLQVGIELTGVLQPAQSSTAPTAGVWQHVAMTWDGTTLRLYLNGVQTATLVPPGFTAAHSTDTLYVGSDVGLSGFDFFGGALDEVAVYGSVLTASQIAGHYQAGTVVGGAGSGDPQTAYGWEEVYGPDYPWNWLTGGQPNDTPVIDNGLVRVRYDSTNTPGFRIDVWNGVAYVEQGKVTVTRVGDVTGVCNTWVSAGLHTDNGYTPDRATVAVTLANSADTSSRERVYITVQRGELGATFECYPAPKAAGTNADAVLQWTPALNSGAADLNNTVVKIDGQGSGSWTPSPPAAAQNSGSTPGILAATAGTGAGTGKSGLFGAVATLGAANFTGSENWAAVLRYPTAYNVIAPYQHTLVVLQAANAKLSYLGNTSTAYGTNTDSYQVTSQNSAGYIQSQVQFSPTQAQQVMECESMTLGANTTAGGDPSASGAATTQSSRVTDANAHATQATWPNSFLATYRVWARVKTTATQMSVYAKTGATTGTTVTVTGAATPSYTWVDLGEIVANNTTFELHAWVSSGAGIVECDRIEAVLVQDRTRTAAIYSGARDSGQAALMDSRWLGAVVAR